MSRGIKKLDTRLPTVVVSSKRLEDIRRTARLQGVSQGSIIRTALDRYLDDQKEAA